MNRHLVNALHYIHFKHSTSVPTSCRRLFQSLSPIVINDGMKNEERSDEEQDDTQEEVQRQPGSASLEGAGENVDFEA